MKVAMIFTFIFFFLINVLADGSNPKVYIIQIRNAIGNGLREYIFRGVEQAKNEKADVLLFDIHTPGGVISATSDIIKIIDDSGLPTIAFVNNEAISAGAIITLSCEKIVMAPGGTIGDAQPIPTNEKTVSYVRGRIYSIAEKQGRNPDVAAAMVDKDIVLVKMEDGSIKALSPEEYAENQKKNISMQMISPKGNVLTVSTDKAIELGVADVKSKSVEELLNYFNIVEVSGKRILEQKNKPVLSKGKIISNLSDAETKKVFMTIPEKIAVFITNPMVASILLALGILGMIMEFKTVGWGVAGTIGLICLALFFGGHMIARIDAGIGLIIFLFGVGLLLVEIFLIPGFGITGITGIILIFFGLLFTIDTKTGSWGEAIQTLSQSLIIMIVLGGFLVYFLPKTSLWKTTVLETEEGGKNGYISSEIQNNLQGKHGITISQLRPAGIALIDDKRVNVISDGSYVDKDVPIEVIKVEGGKVIVRPV